MKQLGDITKLKGDEVPLVDCVIGGSPCQSFSMAGNRKGLDGKSGLFYHYIRLFKEMRERGKREADDYIRPRYFVLENVPGIFSCNHGKDFQTVLREVLGIAQEGIPDVPVPEKGWSYAGILLGQGFSVAWRVHDASKWGVPQRRRRVSLVADFGGFSAGEILFEQPCLCRDHSESEKQREGIAANAAEGVRAASIRMREGCSGGG